MDLKSFSMKSDFWKEERRKKQQWWGRNLFLVGFLFVDEGHGSAFVKAGELKNN